MAARFGRNKRRRAREQIQQQEAVISNMQDARALDAELLRHQRARLADLEDEIAQAKELLPRGSVCVEPGQIKLQGMGPGDAVRVRIDRPLYLPAIDHAAEAETVSDERLHVLIAEADFDQLHRRLHARLRFDYPDVCFAYGIAEDVLMDQRQDVLERLVLRNVAPMLVRKVIEAARAAWRR